MCKRVRNACAVRARCVQCVLRARLGLRAGALLGGAVDFGDGDAAVAREVIAQLVPCRRQLLAAGRLRVSRREKQNSASCAKMRCERSAGRDGRAGSHQWPHHGA